MLLTSLMVVVGLPSAVHEISGAGEPVALHEISAVSSTKRLISLGGGVPFDHRGGTVIRKTE